MEVLASMWKKGKKKNQDRKYIRLPILRQTKFWLNQKTKTASSIGFVKAWWGTQTFTEWGAGDESEARGEDDGNGYRARALSS